MHKQTNKCNTFLLLTFIQAVLCSSFQLPIAALTRPADSTRGLVISREDVYIKTWFRFGSPGFSNRVRRGYATSVGCLGDLVSTKRSLTPAEGSEWKVEKCNWYALMRLSVSGLLVIFEQNGNLRVMHMCSVCLTVLCDFKSAWRNEAGGLQTAATSGDDNVTVNLGVCRQCG